MTNMTNAIETTSSAANTGAHEKKSNNASSGADTTEVFLRMLEGYRKTGAITEVDGGAGDDLINADGRIVRANGGAGNDTINASGYDIRVDGGDGNDVINAQGQVGFPIFPHLHGCFGPMIHLVHCHDHLHAVPFEPQLPGTRVDGGAGDDSITLNGGVASGGSGNDTIINTGGGRVALRGDAGDDTIISYTSGTTLGGSLSGGAGNDDIQALAGRYFIDGGTGDDTITVDSTGFDGVPYVDHHGHVGLNTSLRSFVQGGLGDDKITLANGTDVRMSYFAGDGHDVISGATEGTDLRFGPGLTFESAKFSTADGNLTVSFPDSDGSVTFLDYAERGVPTMEFADGRILDASTTIAYAGGDPDAYAPGEGKGRTETEAKTKDREHDHD